MYISVKESYALDKVIKSNEVSFRSFISDIFISEYPNLTSFQMVLNSMTISENLIYSKRFKARLNEFKRKSTDLYTILDNCKKSLDTKVFNNDVPYVSDLIDLLLIFFNNHFSDKDLIKKFPSIEEFHYCCNLYYKARNNLSHPASKPIVDSDANKIIYFIENSLSTLDSKYFWHESKEEIKTHIKEYRNSSPNEIIKFHNLSYAASTHKSLLCREGIIRDLYDSLLGQDERQRLAGSIVIYGYGGVGKTAITTEFLYRILREKKDGKYKDIEYILFFSSKDEYLRGNHSTGELYIDFTKPEFKNLEELQSLILKNLNIDSISQLDKFKRGIIAIDNIENIEENEKNKIIYFIKSLPRNIQFIITSRNEELCEEKIHVEEFKNDNLGLNFVTEIIESESFNVEIDREKAKNLLLSSKGNALIIIQVLNIISREVSTFEQVFSSLESMKSRNSEMIANFMYKNTFDTALKYLKKAGHPIDEIMQIISLYDEKIELYSLHKLTKIDISQAEIICNYLLERLILKKKGEYFVLNEFAKRFVFTKLLPDRFTLSNLKSKINHHKERMKKKLEELDFILNKNSTLHQNVNEWQPKNYIDKIVIAELFSLYGTAIESVGKRNKTSFEKHIKEFDEHYFITGHPYVPLQKARYLREGLNVFYKNNPDMYQMVESCYEQAIDAIEYDYRYLLGSLAQASLFMFFGAFLSNYIKEYGRAIRFLELSKTIIENHGKNNGWFITCNYLSKAYLCKFEETNDTAYKVQLQKVYTQVINSTVFPDKKQFSIERYKKQYIKTCSN